MNIEIKFTDEKEISIKLSESFIQLKKDDDKKILLYEISQILDTFINEASQLKENVSNIFNVDLHLIEQAGIKTAEQKIKRELDFIMESNIKISEKKREKKDLIKEIEELKLKQQQTSLF